MYHVSLIMLDISPYKVEINVSACMRTHMHINISIMLVYNVCVWYTNDRLDVAWTYENRWTVSTPVHGGLSC